MAGPDHSPHDVRRGEHSAGEAESALDLRRSRGRKSNSTAIERRPISYHEQVRLNYLAQAEADPGHDIG